MKNYQIVDRIVILQEVNPVWNAKFPKSKFTIKKEGEESIEIKHNIVLHVTVMLS